MTQDNLFIPTGYQCLFDAIEEAGKALYPEEWTGEERKLTEMGFYQFESSPRWHSDADVTVDDRLQWRSDNAITVGQRERWQSEGSHRWRCDTEISLDDKVLVRAKHLCDGRLEQNPSKENYRLYHEVPSHSNTKLEMFLSSLDAFRGNMGPHFIWDLPNLDEWQQAHDEEAELFDNVKKLIMRRDVVETACRNALWGQNGSQKCQAYYRKGDGSIGEFPSQYWSMGVGSIALESAHPGYLTLPQPSDLPFKEVHLLLMSGELAKVVIGSHKNTTTAKASNNARQWLAAEIANGEQIENKPHYIGTMKAMDISKKQAMNIWSELVAKAPKWGSSGPKKKHDGE